MLLLKMVLMLKILGKGGLERDRNKLHDCHPSKGTTQLTTFQSTLENSLVVNTQNKQQTPD